MAGAGSACWSRSLGSKDCRGSNPGKPRFGVRRSFPLEWFHAVTEQKMHPSSRRFRIILLSLIINVLTCTTSLADCCYALDFNPSPLSFWATIPVVATIAGLTLFLFKRDKPATLLTAFGILLWLSFLIFAHYFYNPPLFAYTK